MYSVEHGNEILNSRGLCRPRPWSKKISNFVAGGKIGSRFTGFSGLGKDGSFLKEFFNKMDVRRKSRPNCAVSGTVRELFVPEHCSIGCRG